mgnify:CR=1 FL=1
MKGISEREGIVSKIIYKNDNNQYVVFAVETSDGDDETFVGYLSGIEEGMYILARGEYVEHPNYSMQFKVSEYEVKMPDDLMESIEPFDISEAVDFQTAYLAGYLANKYDVTAEESIDRVNARVKRSTEEAFAETVKGYDSVNVENSSIQFRGGKAQYALYPVWLLNTTWNGNQYLFAMNGQTGRFVGDLPIDQSAATKWLIGLTVLMSAVSYGVIWLLHLFGVL